MHQLPGDRYDRAAALFRELAELHLSVDAVLMGASPGEVWVDDAERPSVGLLSGPEGEYLAGAAERAEIYPALKALIPERAYLTPHPETWVQVLPQIWTNRAARHHPRLHLRWQAMRLPQWRAGLPLGFELAAIDAELLGRAELANQHEIVERVQAWHSVDDFLQRGVGFCVIHNGAIVSRCMADCVVAERCEIGVGTDSAYRARGLAAVAVAATVERCLERGLTQIGWHCLRSNAGSRALAEKIGFELAAEYDAYSAVLPSENAADLTPAEYRDWALHYQRFLDDSPWYALFAAEAWALAGERQRALAHLDRLRETGWPDEALLARRWALRGLLDSPRNP